MTFLQVVTVLISLYRKSGNLDPFYITQCISSLLKEMQNREAQIIDPILVNKVNFFQLFKLVCQIAFQ